jgi:hypothetical protein
MRLKFTTHHSPTHLLTTHLLTYSPPHAPNKKRRPGSLWRRTGPPSNYQQL